MKAFPYQGSIVDKEYGMDLRDYFAAKAIQALISREDEISMDRIYRLSLASQAYLIAEAMIDLRGEI